MEEKRIIPAGEWDYRELAGSCYYVDKTLLIRDLWKNGKKVSLFTRPRRFGKSLNMDMLKVFFEKTDEDTSVYIKDMRIWREEALRAEQGEVSGHMHDVRRGGSGHVGGDVREHQEGHSKRVLKTSGA